MYGRRVNLAAMGVGRNRNSGVPLDGELYGYQSCRLEGLKSMERNVKIDHHTEEVVSANGKRRLLRIKEVRLTRGLGKNAGTHGALTRGIVLWLDKTARIRQLEGSWVRQTGHMQLHRSWREPPPEVRSTRSGRGDTTHGPIQPFPCSSLLYGNDSHV